MSTTAASADPATGTYRPVVAVGSSGVEYALAAFWTARRGGPAPEFRRRHGSRVQTLAVSGSRAPASDAQVADALGRGFLGVPVDPVTESDTTWVVVAPEADGEQGAVYDIRSGAPGNGRDGRPYAEW